jgi:hypothetical protein
MRDDFDGNGTGTSIGLKCGDVHLNRIQSGV